MVCNLVRVYFEDPLTVTLSGEFGIHQQGVLEGKDCAPVFHGAEKLALAGCGDVVELGQGEWLVEPALIIDQYLTRGVEGKLGLRDCAAACHDAGFQASGADRTARPFKVAHAEEQEVARHRRSRREVPAHEAIGLFVRAGDR